MTQKKLDRRAFLKHSSRAVLGGAALLAGCSADDEKSARDMASAQDMRQPDMRAADMRAADMSPPEDMAPLDMSSQDMGIKHTLFSKPPFSQKISQDRMRLRFETRTMEALEVQLKPMGGMSEEFMATTSIAMLDFGWPPPNLRSDYRDEPGLHNLQEVIFEGLRPGESYEWTVHQGDGVTRSGVFKAQAPAEQAFKLGWISDTMFPNAKASADALAAANPDLILHGGDLQYMTNPVDTWSGFFHEISGLTAKAAMHTCIGNHEYESMDEFEVQYRRLFEGHGDMGSTIDYSAFTFGGVRFLLLNSEIELADPDSPQHRWMLAEFERIKTSNLRFPVVAFHRPYFTFSKSSPDFATRDALHPIFQANNVPLIFTGHNHCYERFEADGITYVMDGGGGALSYAPDAKRADVLAQRPTDEPLRKFSKREYGATVVTVNPDGTMDIERRSALGGNTETYSIG